MSAELSSKLGIKSEQPSPSPLKGHLKTLFIDHGDKFQYIDAADMADVRVGTGVEDLIDG
jgi:hypothetical protein